MSKVFGIIILFAAAWLMYRLQAGGGCCSGGNQGSGSDESQGQSCCGDINAGSGTDPGKGISD